MWRSGKTRISASMDAFSARGRRFSDGKPFAKPSENGGQNVEFSAGAGRGRRIWHDMARIAENRFPHRKTVWRVAVEKTCPPGKTGSFTPFPQSFPHPAEGDFFTGKIAECAAFFRFPVFLHTGFPPLSTTSPQPVENSVETVGKGLGGRGKWGVRGVRWCFLTTEIPPAGAPLGAGFAVRRWLAVVFALSPGVPLRSG